MSRNPKSIPKRTSRSAAVLPTKPIDIEALAIRQGVKPVEDFAKFLEEIGDVWPEGESVDEFVAAIRALRRESTARSNS